MKAESGRALIEPSVPVCNIGCPKEPGRQCQAWVKPSPGAVWENHGTEAAPTLSPSYHCVNGCGWHGYVVDGKLVDTPAEGISTIHICANCKHPEIHTVHISAVPQPEGAMAIGLRLSRTIVRPTADVPG